MNYIVRYFQPCTASITAGQYAIETCEVEARMNTPSVRAIIDMGYSTDLIGRTIERRLVATGNELRIMCFLQLQFYFSDEWHPWLLSRELILIQAINLHILMSVHVIIRAYNSPTSRWPLKIIFSCAQDSDEVRCLELLKIWRLVESSNDLMYGLIAVVVEAHVFKQFIHFIGNSLHRRLSCNVVLLKSSTNCTGLQ